MKSCVKTSAQILVIVFLLASFTICTTYLTYADDFSWSPDYNTRLLEQIYISEIGYAEIQSRTVVLQSKSRTPTEQKELDDYNKKLQHDRDTITNWKSKVTYNAQTRSAILDKVIAAEQTEIITIQNRLNEVNAKKADTQEEIVQKQIDIASLTEYIKSHTDKITIINTLKSMNNTTVFGKW